MATECSQESVLRFLTERGGRVRNAELIDHFRPAIPTDPGRKAEAKEAFKRYVDSVAIVKVDNGEKYVCLKKKFRGALRGADGGTCADHAPDSRAIVEKKGNGGTSVSPVSVEKKENEEVKQEIPLGSGCGTDGITPCFISQTSLDGAASASLSAVSESEMGNQPGSHSDPFNSSGRSGQLGQTVPISQPQFLGTSVPGIKVIEASPLPVVTDGTVFKLPEVHLAHASAVVDGGPDQVPRVLGTEVDLKTQSREEIGGGKGSHGLRRRPSRGSQRSRRLEAGTDDGHSDAASVSGSDNTPKGSRKSFIEHMISSSPQVRRSMVLRGSIHLSTKSKEASGRSDVDSASVNSSNADEESAPVILDPLEHEWMMCASDGQWESLQGLLASDPNLINKKDFVTGFTCLHWAAKTGKHELLALLLNFAKKHGVAVNVDARSSAGYTPLHLAAMHNHLEVVKLLVGAYDADVEVRDYNGKKPCQYLRRDVAQELLDIVGASADSDAENVGAGDAGRWKLSKVLQSNLRPLKLLNHSASEDDVRDCSGQANDKPLRRKSSLNKLKPRLSKMRLRTSIVHSTSLFDKLEREVGEASASFRSRPKSNLFG